ncbi:sacsin N-terminal ATP-binding-like domain-containing protein [Cohnella fermenti]|uniref:Sacsin/Nov domain-containing protein n=1 Tax=Cohnella fermenti TaxID=2565925 RepID=A0A4S4BSW9_9BACL|nr:ATP-binding protein [Cohnella fermenti]THF77351.1 hypothetical protein E6C55_16955 [Cohnella fermenti]
MGQFTLAELRDINKLVTSRRELYEKTQDIQSMYEASRAMYSDDSAFVLELLQNSDDCTANKVEIYLNDREISLKHNGKCFDLSDIEQITKASQVNNSKATDDSKIGKFGIGFKSVFNVTAKPKITSGKYQFEIHDYLIPKFNIPNIEGETSDLSYTENYDTCIELPYTDGEVFQKVYDRLRDISSRYLLFLNHITALHVKVEKEDEIVYENVVSKENITKDFFALDKCNSGFRELMDAGIVSVYQISKKTYLVIDGRVVGDKAKSGNYYKNIKIAFEVTRNSDGEIKFIFADNSNFNVFFPTNTHAGLGYLIQGKYTVGMSRKELYNANLDIFSDLNNSQILDVTIKMLICVIDLFSENGLINKSFLNVILHFNKGSSNIIKSKFEESLLNYFLNNNKIQLGEHSRNINDILFTDDIEIKNIFKANHFHDNCCWIDSQYIGFHGFFSKIQGVKVVDFDNIIQTIATNKSILDMENIKELYKYLLKKRGKIENLKFIKTNTGEYVTLNEKDIYLDNGINNLSEVVSEINKETNLTFAPIFIDENIRNQVGSLLKLTNLRYSSIIKFIEKEYFVPGDLHVKNLKQYFAGFILILKLIKISGEKIELKNIPIIVKNNESGYSKRKTSDAFYIEDEGIKSLYVKSKALSISEFIDNEIYNRYVPDDLQDELMRFFAESEVKKNMFEVKEIDAYYPEFFNRENREIFEKIPKPINYKNEYSIYSPTIVAAQNILKFLSENVDLTHTQIFIKLLLDFFAVVKDRRGYIRFYYKKWDSVLLNELDFITMLKSYSWIVIDKNPLKTRQVSLKDLKNGGYLPSGYNEQVIFAICDIIGIDRGEYSSEVKAILNLLKSRTTNELILIDSEISKLLS